MSSGWHRKRRTPADAIRAKQYASPEHKQRRAAIQAQLNAGVPVSCWRCGSRIYTRFHLGHDDNDRRIYRGAECPTCNLKAAASKGAKVANARRNGLRQPSAHSRTW